MVGASALAIGLAGAGANARPAAALAAPRATAFPGDWPTWQRDLRGSRNNPHEHGITPDNVSGLKLKWAFAYPKEAGTPRSQPAVVNGTIYFGGPDGKLYARDARTGAAKWEFDTATVGTGATPVQDSPAVVRGKVYFGDKRGYLYALDQRTGRLVWARRLDSSESATVTGSPIVFDGRVYVGVSSWENLLGTAHACCTFRGHVDALDADTGRPAWRFYTVRPPRKDGTWPNGVTRYAPSGAGVWSTPAIDPATRTLFVGTGQNYSGSGGHFDSLLALDTATGAVRWTRKMTPTDTWRIECSSTVPEEQKFCPNLDDGTALDYDVGAAPNVFTMGHRRVVGIGQKSGVYHLLDARTGEVIWERALSTPMPNGGLSGIQWGTSYDGHRLYVATYAANPGTLYALAPATGRILWKTPNPTDGCTTGGAAQYPDVCALGHTPAVTTTPGLVWEGGIDGKMRAYSASTGQVLWTFDTIRDFGTVNGEAGRGGAISGGGGAVVSHGMLYIQSGYFFNPYPTDKGSVLMAFG
ncbi:hypothetical protein E1293_00090 [Actinomadura darangshiensis]|uniref:Pyrrolo-quinoline quinone repeat domain-containing protein n=1 Tax=Actinomadura darangshiensis TaxID=705336 RepID=A0A4R5C047_9ACTN|nr:PQQ-binding-like beta-propeller repeat protein [Actinomadura darangshiensis]TDD92911.1 hypothetical protein E1293_00090 [Actinomadura darangshiensis]